VTLNPDVVRARASEIEESVARLEELARLPVEEFVSNRDAVDVACYRLLRAIEAALALCYHVCARRLHKAPDDYAACFGALREAGLVPADLASRLERLARFRNLLVHMYWRLDHARVHAIIQHDLADLRAFSTIVIGLLTEEDPGAEPPHV
jgi:uncharacterized protein YutE (UPF0331/DUF86 family)